MPGPSVTVVDRGGIAVTVVEKGAPVFSAVAKGGVPITVIEKGGIPIVLDGEIGPLPPFQFLANKMTLGMGMAGISSYSGYYPFANVAWNCGLWERNSGTGAFTQDFGKLTAATSTDTFKAKFGEGFAIGNLPAGTYTVLNPDGRKIGVGWGATPHLTGWTTATQFTFTKDASPVIALWAEGSVTNVLGPIQIIMPGRLAAFQAGNPWNPDFLTFEGGLGARAFRFMDWLQAYNDLSVNWTDVAVGLPITLNAPQTKLTSKVPFQLVVDLANRFGIDPWINVPVRASDDYIDNLAAYLLANLNSNRYVYVEYGNETWNYAGAFNDARVWVEHLPCTPYTATPNVGVNGWTRTAHGLTNGERVASFFDKANFTYIDNLIVYPLGYGSLLYVEVLDANNFRLREGSVSGTIVPPTAAITQILYKKHVEAGKTVDVNINHGIRSKQLWDRFDAVLGRNRCVHILASHLVTPDPTTVQRLSPTGVAAATDAVAVAAYYQGDWWLAALDIASGQVTPKAWSMFVDGSVRVAIYANGSTPTLAEVMAGAGAGYIGHRDIAITSQSSSSFFTAAAITGLTNGTSYAVRAVLTGLQGYRWMASATFTASASASTFPVPDSDENMAMRARRDSVEYISPFMNAQTAVIGGKPLVCYESGSDYFGPGQSLPQLVKDWRTAYTQTAIAGEAFGYFYRTMATRNLKLMNQFVDINGDPGVFNLAESFTDTSDPRYLKFIGFAGTVNNNPPLVVGDVTAPDVSTEPSYPATVATLTSGLTYRIFNGDVNSNFAISGNLLRIVNGFGINWGLPTVHTLTIEADNGFTTDYFTVQFATGNAWYESDARFAWNTLTDTDTAALNPEAGGVLALTGTAATYDSGTGLWDFNQVGRYSSNLGLTATFTGDNAILIAAVIDKDDHTWDYGDVLQIGDSAFCQYYCEDFGKARARWFAAGSETQVQFAAASPTGKHVLWTYYDADPTTPKLHAGVDQAEFGTGTARSLAGVPFSRGVYIGGKDSNFSKMDHGSMEVVSRAGMTLATAKAIVAKIQALHGI